MKLGIVIQRQFGPRTSRRVTILDDADPRALLTMGKGHPVFAISLRARPCDGAQSPFHPFRQRIFEYGQPYQQLIDRAMRGLGDPFIEGEVLHF